MPIPGMDGGTLIHSDLNPANLIITTNGLRIVDWAYTTKAAPWVELALLVQWLIGSGHTAAQAEQRLAPFPAWTTTDLSALDQFASNNASKWSAKSLHSREQWVQTSPPGPASGRLTGKVDEREPASRGWWHHAVGTHRRPSPPLTCSAAVGAMLPAGWPALWHGQGSSELRAWRHASGRWRRRVRLPMLLPRGSYPTTAKKSE
ncbi:phosphotransferase [Micromonospora musae]|uniref:phosphotransferase family protein n=1 Tax=Micromonospora musae TaxID=1894970 RepID=UPI00341A02F5